MQVRGGERNVVHVHNELAKGWFPVLAHIIIEITVLTELGDNAEMADVGANTNESDNVFMSKLPRSVTKRDKEKLSAPMLMTNRDRIQRCLAVSVVAYLRTLISCFISLMSVSVKF